MITITISDTATTSPLELRAVAQCLISIADGDKCATLRPAAPAPAPLPRIIAPEDMPDVGVDIKLSRNKDFMTTAESVALLLGETLREPALDPRAAFGAVPNVPASSIAVAPALPTAPVVPPVTSIPPVPVPLPHVPPALVTDAPAGEGAASDAPFDKTGLPWDARIHSRGRSMNTDGTWRAKRGVDDATVASVAAELRAVPGVPTTLDDDVAAAEAGWPFKPLAAVAPPPPPVAASAIVSFPAFMGKYVPHIEPAGPVTQAQLTEILVAHGVPNIAVLSARTDLLPAISAQLDQIIAAA